ncbi:hypothetical protein MKW98_016672 [Papaver atlanticum]|uniref:AAA+ ATPase domain-containing protein n=1 Tax=Papaver atlanticum TaxID=357466 RepID=A0AAD4SQZ2_9MAGN|nr:hypothetical protein MKW98_016672 [Papaver atlanticum]
MEAISPIIDIISCLWNCSAVHKNYLCESKENVSSLKSSLKKLKERRDDVKERVDLAESNPSEPAKCTHEVGGWLDRVEILEQDVESILQEGEAANNGGNYFCCWGRKNCCRSYKLGKSAVKKKNAVEKLWEEGNFNTVVERSQPGPFQEIAANQMVGMESQLERIWSLLADETSKGRIVGLYGMGGVGKTTLLENLNNEFLKRKHHFDKVIWVTVSRDRAKDIKHVQKQICKSLGLSWSEETDIDEIARCITQVLKKKKFVLFIDDIWEGLELQKIGIPNLKITTQEVTKCRVIFTTRFESVCGFMKANESIRLDCLSPDDSWRLFQQNVGQRALTCHPNVSEVAIKVAKECLGLPLALITIGQTMASKKTLQEWQYALTVLGKSASEFSGMSNHLNITRNLGFNHLNLVPNPHKFSVCCSFWNYCTLLSARDSTSLFNINPI